MKTLLALTLSSACAVANCVCIAVSRVLACLWTQEAADGTKISVLYKAVRRMQIAANIPHTIDLLVKPVSSLFDHLRISMLQVQRLALKVCAHERGIC